MKTLMEKVRNTHREALEVGRSAMEAFEAASEACRQANPSMQRSEADRLVLGLLRQAAS